MTEHDELQHEDEEQLTEEEKRQWNESEEEKRRCDELEDEERRRGQANNGLEGQVVDVYGHKASPQTKTQIAEGNVNSDRPSKPRDSDLSANAGNFKHDEIVMLFRTAADKLDKVDDDAKKEKQQIVRDLARDLEKFRPIDRIASEIVEELCKKVSKSVVYAALDEKYKTSYRVHNARKRKKGKDRAESLAPTSELKPLIIDTSGHITQRQVSEPDSSDESTDAVTDNSKPLQQLGATQDSKSVTINKTQEIVSGNDGGIDTDTLPTATIDIAECGQCKIKDSEGESTITPSFNDEIASTIEQNEDLTDANKKVFVSSISIPFEPLWRDMQAVFRMTKGIGKVFFKASFDLEKGVAKIEFCGNTQHKDVAMTSKGKGRISEEA